MYVVSACSGLEPGAQAPRQQDTCGGAQYQNLIGEAGTSLERTLILGEVRIIRPGQAVTLDYRPSRLNFEIGASGRIVDIRCG